MKLIQKSVVFHVGELDISKKRKFSYETGLGISVSEHPMEWAEIAELSGNVYKFTAPQGVFLDVYKLTESDMDLITRWGISNKLIKISSIYYFTYYDSESESMMKMEFESKRKATDNAEGEKVRKKIGMVATQKFHRLIGWKIDQLLVKDYLIVYFAHAMDIDGVWFNDKLDVANYSAPRGMIFDDKLLRWRIEQVSSISNLTN